MSSSVGASLLFSGKGARNISFVSQQMPPTTHWPSMNRPLSNFRLPNFDSSTSTVSHVPPISLLDCWATISKQISRK